MTNNIHPDAPTDSDGHPVHPEKGHRICGRGKSDRTTPTDHGRERDDIPFCTLTAGWGVDGKDTGACDHHGGSGGAPPGEDNGNYKHGAYSEHFQSDLSDREQEAYDDLVKAFDDQERAKQVVDELTAEALLKYKRSGDHRFLREARQLMSEFNIADATDHLDVDGVDGMLMKDLREAHDE
ncbi:hypothetical protein [Haloarcula onubensis]|uniref:Uncharacterized protein n=1 Tax=Haloarcula onubensis TaxID=2950539 RepID=A0ABU2FVD2_9EURY|nr:hypothetical protein [Halomicroarcula sp. S3CR25-11]MDS0284728.1 hypothetical protein [Halomicroarcula sp. S3CR25-11]